MKLYVYADESGTFDKVNNYLFVYGGVIVPGSDAKANIERQYIAVEKSIKEHSSRLNEKDEAKASALSMRERKRLYGVIESSPCCQFATVVDQKALRAGVFDTKQSKQRYLDWALKMGIKTGVLAMIRDGIVGKNDIEKIAIYVDEHSSSTSGRYNLHDSINEEFRSGMYDPSGYFREPVFSSAFPEIPVHYLDSKRVTLIRAADVTANWVYCAERDREWYPYPMQRVRENVALYRHP